MAIIASTSACNHEARVVLAAVRQHMCVTKEVVLPSGHYFLRFREGVTENEIHYVTEEFSRAAKAWDERFTKEAWLFRFQYGFGPLILLYAVGWSVGWVYRGFKTRPV